MRRPLRRESWPRQAAQPHLQRNLEQPSRQASAATAKGGGARAAKRAKGGGAKSAPRPLLGQAKGQAITSYFARPEGQARLGGV